MKPLNPNWNGASWVDTTPHYPWDFTIGSGLDMWISLFATIILLFCVGCFLFITGKMALRIAASLIAGFVEEKPLTMAAPVCFRQVEPAAQPVKLLEDKQKLIAQGRALLENDAAMLDIIKQKGW